MTKPRSRMNLRGRIGSIAKMALVSGLGLASAACIQLTAPERPIEINLNINIRQEVLVSLRKDVQDLVDKNPGVF